VDFGGFGVWIEYFVEGDPFAGVGSAGGLVEIEGGLATKIEGSPVEEGLGGGLCDVDIIARGCRWFGTRPSASHDRVQAAFYESVGDGIGCYCGAGGGLEGAHVVDGLGGAGEAVLGADFGGLGCGGSSVGAGFGVSLGVAAAGSATEDVAGLESAGGHGGQEGGEERACENGARTPARREELEGAEVIFSAVAGFQHGQKVLSFKNRSVAEKDCCKQPEGWSEAKSIKF
jgi:hypothetical protein